MGDQGIKPYQIPNYKYDDLELATDLWYGKKTYSYLVYATCFVYLSGILVDTSDIHVVERRN